DALLAVERHATSKIRTADDIERVATLGFRGEALAAIAAVTRFTLRTRRKDALAGTEINMAGGKILDVREASCPLGTSVEARALFFNLPARRKFLRTDTTELSHIRQFFIRYALAHPRCAMRLSADGRELYNLPGGATLGERLGDLLPAESVAQLCRLDYEDAAISLQGYAGRPAGGRADRSEQYLFINGRPAGAPVLSAAIREAYHSLLPRNRFPVILLFMRLDPALVDVNIHPAKREVRFRDPAAVRAAIIKAIRHALGQREAPMPGLAQDAAAPAAAALAGLDRIFRSAARPLATPHQSMRAPPAPPPPTLPAWESSPASAPGAPWSRCRILGQVQQLYVVMETEDGLVLMDPHAAHERILYEHYLATIAQGRVASQGLLSAETVELTPGHARHIRRQLDLLKKMGFGIAEFGGDTFVIDALPACLAAVPPGKLLPDVAATLAAGAGSSGRLLEEEIAQAACRAAVKAQQALSLPEIEALVIQLSQAAMPYTCPHGRPTLIHMSFQELAKKFGRA
ncbi:MAG: DNA mismatch repair protein MutL, partial [Lentisphaerae bacterium]|nr:DNA mismatch repair protein MutL [Lentisphaerota bacterium]